MVAVNLNQTSSSEVPQPAPDKERGTDAVAPIVLPAVLDAQTLVGFTVKVYAPVHSSFNGLVVNLCGVSKVHVLVSVAEHTART